jgi:hypothetical protein
LYAISFVKLNPLALMETKLSEVRQLLSHRSNIKDSEIRETLWYYYFDVERSASWLLGLPTENALSLISLDKYSARKAFEEEESRNGHSERNSTKGRFHSCIINSLHFLLLNTRKTILTLLVSREGQRPAGILLEDLKLMVCSSN